MSVLRTNYDKPRPDWIKASSRKLYWCNVHERRATYMVKYVGATEYIPHCNPNLGGIMMPCKCVDLTGLVEITYAPEH